MKTLDALKQKVQNAPELDFGTIFNQSIELFKKSWIQGLVMLLLSMAFTLPFMLLIWTPMLSLGLFGSDVTENEFAIAGSLIVSIGLMLVVVMVLNVALMALQAGIFRIYRQIEAGATEGFNYMYFLKGPHLGKLFKLSLLIMGISLAATFLCVLPLIYVSVPLSLVTVVYAFNPHLSAMDIVKLCFDLGNKKWFLIFGLAIVSAFLAEIVGFLMCGIGIFVTVSFINLPKYFVYKEVMGFDEDDTIDEIGLLNE